MIGKKKINLQSKEEVHNAITHIINDQFDKEITMKKDEINLINDNLKVVSSLINSFKQQYDDEEKGRRTFASYNLFQSNPKPIYFRTSIHPSTYVQLKCKECGKDEFLSEVGFLAHMRDLHNEFNLSLQNISQFSDPLDSSFIPTYFLLLTNDNKLEIGFNEKNNNSASAQNTHHANKRKRMKSKSVNVKRSKNNNNNEDDDEAMEEDKSDDDDDEDDDESENYISRKKFKNSENSNQSKHNITKSQSAGGGSHNNNDDDNNNNINNENNSLHNNNINNNRSNAEYANSDKKKEDMERKKERWRERHCAFLISKGIILRQPKVINNDSTTNDTLLSRNYPAHLKSFITKRIIIGNTSKFVPKKLREQDDDTTHKWMIYVRGPEDEPDLSHYVKKVRFFLHESFAPNDVVDVIHSPFRIVRRGWGEFPVLIQIYFLANIHAPVDYTHHLKLDKSCSGLPLLGSEAAVELHFDPTYFLDLYKLQQHHLQLPPTSQ